MYEAAWKENHENWINLETAGIGCKADEPRYFPVCVGGYMLQPRGGQHNTTCSKVMCIPADSGKYPESNSACFPTPSDTMDYAPPARPDAPDNDSVICPVPLEYEESFVSDEYAFSTGIPPEYTPIRVVKLNFTGVVRGQGAPGECGHIIEGAEIDAWQINPTDLNKFTATTMREEVLGTTIQTDYAGNTKTADIYDDWSGKTPHTQAPSQLRDISCRGFTLSDSDGTYRFETLMPPSHGPPRYIQLQVSAPGYQTLTTRMYFEDDLRLQHLTTLNGFLATQDPHSSHIAQGHATDTLSGDTAWGGTAGQDYSKAKFPGEIARDPRVIPLIWKERDLDETWDFPPLMKRGYLTGVFDIVLSAKRPNVDTGSGDLTSADVDGLWLDEQGGLVSVETRGNQFHASQYPHHRTWGTVYGVMDGDMVRGVNFMTAPSIGNMAKAGPAPMAYNPSLLSSAASTGLILHTDPTTTGPKTAGDNVYEELSILWSSSERQTFRWSRQHDIERAGYRYLKLVITRDTDPPVNHGTGELIINEIQFFEGALAQHELPAKYSKMKAPHYPIPQRVSCSSFTNQFHHCFRAFDGVETSNSSWRTLPVGSSAFPNDVHEDNYGSVLAEPQWVLFDFGANRDINPSALRIVCGAQDADSPKGCPRTFTLYGSSDSKRFSKLYSEDLYDYDDDYANGGKLFTFFWEAPTGRPDGHRCGSCNMGPNFRCSLDSFDSTCVSKYCTRNGQCGQLPTCRPGEYMHYHFTSEGQPAVECKACSAGRYGASAGLFGSYCSGPCQAGYYCPIGSTSATELECGAEGFYCPEGTGAPIPAAAGRHTVFEVGTSYAPTTDAYIVDRAINASKPMGSNNYISSPQLNYNASITLNDTLTGGNVSVVNVTFGFVDSFGQPLRPTTRTFDVMCQYGHYCSLGVMHPCPLGRYGDRRGLATSECADSCVAGEYCPVGSVTPTICEKGYYCPDGKLRVPCPAGKYGSRTGLPDRACSGKCKAGYYCPAGSKNLTEEICPGGTYGATAGLQSPTCSGDCEAGYYCPDGSTNATAYQCGDPSLFCPRGSSAPFTVWPHPAHYTVGGDKTRRQAQRLCEQGYYCMYGDKFSCPRGTYGNATGMWDTEQMAMVNGTATGGPNRNSSYDGQHTGFICSGLCTRGYYCPVNSTSPTQVPCPPGRYGPTDGQKDDMCYAQCPLGHYCPSGTADPIKCPAGRFGNVSGLVSEECSNECWEGGCDPNLCQEGHYCPEGSIHARQYQCGGPAYYCPTGAAVPTSVTKGFYTVGPFPLEDSRMRVTQLICPPGYYCRDGLKIPCPPGTYGDEHGLSTDACSGDCPLGHFCPLGSFDAKMNRCPAGRYGFKTKLSQSSCSGLCAQGYHCPEASTTPYEFECSVLTTPNRTDNGVFNRAGDDTGFINPFIESDTQEIDFSGPHIAANLDMVRTEIVEPNAVFCPEGTSTPVFALPGYYTIGQTKTTRYDQVACPVGAYCVNGVIHDCPSGRYGMASRLDSSNCTGPCAPGHYCPRGSVHSQEIPCPIGRYGAIEGLGTSLCSGPCKKALDCPLGSKKKQPSLTRHDSAVY